MLSSQSGSQRHTASSVHGRDCMDLLGQGQVLAHLPPRNVMIYILGLRRESQVLTEKLSDDHCSLHDTVAISPK